ncbi:glycosyltransferase family 9 protein [Agromyces bauzanensis]
MAAELGRPLSVAVVRSDGIGDWVMTIPLFVALNESRHVGRATIVAPPAYRGLLQRSDRFGFEDFLPKTILKPPFPGGLVGKVIAASAVTQQRAIRAGRAHSGEFDLAILPRWDTDVGLNARAWVAGTGAPAIGHDPHAIPGVTRKEAREARVLANVVVDPDARRHEVRHLEALLTVLGLPATVPRSFAVDFFGDRPRSADGPIVLHTASIEPKRQWPGDRWRELIGRLLEETDRRIVVIGSAADEPAIAEVVSGFPDRVSAAAGTIPLRELPGFLAGAAAFIGNDSGPAHIAASLGVPVVVVSPHPVNGDPTHRNSPDRFRPWGDNVLVARPARAIPPCSDACVSSVPHCIVEVTVDDVSVALQTVLSDAPPPRADS